MASNLRLLKLRIRTAHNIAQIAKTLEMVSVAKIRRARTLVDTVMPYSKRITALTDAVLRTLPPETPPHAYMGPSSSQTRLVIAIGPEKGLCGPLVSNLMRKLLELDDPRTLVVTVGKRMERVAMHLAESKLIASFPLGTLVPQYSLVYDVSRLADEMVMSGRAGSVELLHARFVSVFSQVPTVERVIPLAPRAAPSSEIPPAFEPSSAALLGALLPHYLEVRIFDAIVQAYTAEHAARMVAMQNAKNNALDIGDSLTLAYNKTRQERITNEILDLANQGKIG